MYDIIPISEVVFGLRVLNDNGMPSFVINAKTVSYKDAKARIILLGAALPFRDSLDDPCLLDIYLASGDQLSRCIWNIGGPGVYMDTWGEDETIP